MAENDRIFVTQRGREIAEKIDLLHSLTITYKALRGTHLADAVDSDVVAAAKKLAQELREQVTSTSPENTAA